MTDSLQNLLQGARAATAQLSSLETKKKNTVLSEIAKQLEKSIPSLVNANQKDLELAQQKGLSPAMIDRLRLDDKRIRGMASAIRDVIKLKDPVGQVVEKRSRNGLKIQKVRIPLGVIGIIYESRPNVTTDAAALTFKSGNAVILRGGSEAFHSNSALVQIVRSILKKHKLPEDAVTMVPDTGRESMIALLQRDDLIDVIIPRGGEGLMKFIREHSRIPVIKHDKGVCSIFVDSSAKIKQALDVIYNAKVQRPGVCNAVETIYVHRQIAKKFLPELDRTLNAAGVELRADEEARKFLPHAQMASEIDYGTEYLDLILAVKTVKNIDDAIENIRRYSSQHTESILTSNKKNASQFVRALDSSCVMINTSTRFNDGGELGLGAEIGISTTKLHAYGPMGLNELTTTKFIVESNYRTRA